LRVPSRLKTNKKEWRMTQSWLLKWGNALYINACCTFACSSHDVEHTNAAIVGKKLCHVNCPLKDRVVVETVGDRCILCDRQVMNKDKDQPRELMEFLQNPSNHSSARGIRVRWAGCPLSQVLLFSSIFS
jgi:hypothetical protein